MIGKRRKLTTPKKTNGAQFGLISDLCVGCVIFARGVFVRFFELNRIFLKNTQNLEFSTVFRLFDSP